MTRDNNSIKKKVMDLHEELTRAKHVVKDIKGSLESCTEATNLTETIGIYARQMPNFKILAEQRVSCLSFVRQVCTGELKKEEALELLGVAEKHLNEALDCIKL
jgi:hypothetical protein